MRNRISDEGGTHVPQTTERVYTFIQVLDIPVSKCACFFSEDVLAGELGPNHCEACLTRVIAVLKTTSSLSKVADIFASIIDI